MKSKRILMLLSLVVVLLINILANTLPINGLTTGEISDRFPILFVPAGYVFSIWGLIYLALIGFAVYSVTPKGRNNSKIDDIAGWFVAANLFNAVWILLWHYLQFTLTLIPILGLLVSLIFIYLKLGIGKSKRSWIEYILVSAPFSIYLGWATVAVVANITQVLYNFGYRGAPITEPIWAAILLIVATLIGLILGLKAPGRFLQPRSHLGFYWHMGQTRRCSPGGNNRVNYRDTPCASGSEPDGYDFI